jgi:hypothetical protein
VREKANIGNFISTVILVCGILAIIISSSNYLIQERIEDDLSKLDYNKGDDNAENNHKIIYLPDFLAPITSFHINIDQVQDILSELPFVTEVRRWYEKVFEYQVISYFKVLFQYIIAPNAP